MFYSYTHMATVGVKGLPTTKVVLLYMMLLLTELLGQLTVVVGAPGSGKSSLIAALLGEMTCLAGMIIWKP